MAREPTPHQLARREAKREAIVAAAAEILRTRGVAACTVRAIATVSPLTKSAIHYYFDDVEEIVDLAFTRLMEQFSDRLEKAAAGAPGPAEALWAAAEAYVRLGEDRPGADRIPMMAFDFQVTSLRRGDTRAMTAATDRVAAVFHRLVVATGVPAPAARADTLFSALIGTVVRQPLRHRDVDQVLDEIATTVGLPGRGGSGAEVR